MEFVDVFLMNGTFPLMRIWKHLVDDTIRKYELSKWTQRLNDDDEFDSFKSLHQVYQPHSAWMGIRMRNDMAVYGKLQILPKNRSFLSLMNALIVYHPISDRHISFLVSFGSP
jgi:hypothetical protein